MSDITVHYFDAHGRGEALRILLIHSRTQFTDHRISFEEWAQLKASGFTEFGQLPMVEADGLKLVQFFATFRYLGVKLGYVPDDPVLEYQIESLFGLREDYTRGLLPAFRSKDQEAIDKWFDENSPKYLGFLETRLSRNNDGTGWFVGDRITLADIIVFAWIWNFYLRAPMAKYDVPVRIRTTWTLLRS